MTKVDCAEADPIDIAVGVRVRLRRKQMGLSQDKLAQALGISFQQVQKYERGANRISASTLVRIATALGVSTSEFFGDATASDHAAVDTLMRLALEPGVIELAQAFVCISDPKRRRSILDLAKLLVDEG